MARSRSRKNEEHKLTSKKAGEILKHGEVRGHELTPKAERYMGWVRGGRKPRKGKK